MTRAPTTSSITPGINSDGFRTLREGARVCFDSEPGPKGPKAVNVTAV